MTSWPELYNNKQWNSFDKSQADFQLWLDMQDKTNTLIIPIILNSLLVWLFVDFVLPWVKFIGVVLLRWGFGTVVVPVLQYVKKKNVYHLDFPTPRDIESAPIGHKKGHRTYSVMLLVLLQVWLDN